MAHIALPEKGKFMIVSIQKTLWGVVILFGLFAIVSFGAVLITSERELPHLLEVAAYAAGLSIAAFALEILLSLLNEKRSKWENEIANRREVLNQRFQIDEPRLCSKREMPCTCWSFCGGDPDLNADPNTVKSPVNIVPLKHISMLGVKAEFEVDSLPVVDRSHITDCPFP